MRLSVLKIMKYEILYKYIAAHSLSSSQSDKLKNEVGNDLDISSNGVTPIRKYNIFDQSS